MLKTCSFVLLLSTLSNFGFCQEYIPKITIETGVQVSAGRFAPFMMNSNRFGVYGIDKNMGFVRFQMKKDTIRKFDYIYAFDAVNRVDIRNHLFIQQAYAGLRYRKLFLYAGTKEDVFGNQDRVLSSGGILWSGNARPMPKVFLGMYDYADVPWTHGKLQFKAGISHGWFGEKDQFVKNAYLHDKYLFGKINFNKFSVHAGLHHSVMWGGVSPDPAYGSLGSSWKDFWKVFLVQSGGEQNVEAGEFNTVGNHVASYQFGLDFSSSRFNYSLYMQTFLEDKNGRIDYRFDRKNRPDGLWGLSVRNINKEATIQGFLFEYMHSKQQSGDPLKSGNDNYFNNGVYRSGWQYKGMTIGTPLITSPSYIHGEYNLFNYLPNNRVIAFHLGIFGKLKGNYFSVKNTFTLNYGTVDYPFNKPQNYTYFDYQYKFKKYRNLFLTVESGFDIGKLLGNNVGIRCILQKSF